MNWNNEQQARFDELRQQELAGTLNEAEIEELEDLTALLTQEADDALLSAIDRLRNEQTVLETRLQQRQLENEELAKLMQQQEQLTAESRQWLRDFDRRHAQIRRTYTRLTGEVLASR